MKKIYSFVFISLLIAGCSKDVLRSYEDRLVGTWNLADVDRRGIGGSLSHLPFVTGKFVFEESGKLTYTSDAGIDYSGSWDISRRTVSNGCTTDENGNQDCSERYIRRLHITAIDFNTQDVKTENFEEIEFRSSNHFKAFIRSGLHTYVFSFRR
jgi:hypothetical protein